MSRASIVVLFSRFWSGVPSRTMARPGSRSPLCPLLSTRCWAGQSRGSPFPGVRTRLLCRVQGFDGLSARPSPSPGEPLDCIQGAAYKLQLCICCALRWL
jgi:hypothetical protein